MNGVQAMPLDVAVDPSSVASDKASPTVMKPQATNLGRFPQYLTTSAITTRGQRAHLSGLSATINPGENLESGCYSATGV